MNKLTLIALITLGIASFTYANVPCESEHRTVFNSKVVKTMCIAPKNILSKDKSVIEFTSDFDSTEIRNSSYQTCQMAEEAAMKNLGVTLNIKCKRKGEVITSITID